MPSAEAAAAARPEEGVPSLPSSRGGPPAPPAPVGLLQLGAVLARIGATTFGGMWAASRRLEAELVERRGWLTPAEQRALMIASTLIPAPKFLSFGGLVGVRLRGWAGAVVALVALVAPGGLLVLAGVMLVRPELMGEAVVPMQRAVGVAVVGLLLGNAARQVRDATVGPRDRRVGLALGAAVALAAILGVSLILAALAGLAAGAALIGRGEGKA